MYSRLFLYLTDNHFVCHHCDLGLRLFSHPWVGVDENGDGINKGQPEQTLQKLGYSEKTSSALVTMGLMNCHLIERSKCMLQKHVAPHVSPAGLVGSADFNLTLVNKMEPTSTKRDMKKANLSSPKYLSSAKSKCPYT